MIPPRFCNYNIDYQQRLGFLKVLCAVSEQARGGAEEILDRIRDLFPEARRPIALQTRSEPFDPTELVCHLDVPSWQPGFTFQRLDRLVLWGEMLGLIAPNGRLSDWATILSVLDPRQQERAWVSNNPFILSSMERAFFVQLLLYHDHVLPLLIRQLGNVPAGTRIGSREACSMVTRAMSDLLQLVSGSGPEERDVRVALRDVLERIGEQYGIDNPRRLISQEHRDGALQEVAEVRGRRAHLAEYHTICRFEQLTDLGLLVKEQSDEPAPDDDSRRAIRTAWSWCTTAGLASASEMIGERGQDVEAFLTSGWMSFCERGMARPCRRLHAIRDQVAIAEFLDDALAIARRQLGPVQVHMWASIACLRAFDRGTVFELSDVFELLEATRGSREVGAVVRLGGRRTLRGRTASVGNASLATALTQHPLHVGGNDED